MSSNNKDSCLYEPKILVIGAGAAGLAAARTIAGRGNNSNCRVRVLEASDKIGGRMFCDEIDGFHVYSGASTIHESFKTVRDLAAELNVDLHRSPRLKGAQIYADDRFWGLYVGGSLRQSLTSLRTMLFSPCHTLGGALQMMRLFSILKNNAEKLDFELDSRILELDSNESFAEFARANSLGRYMRQGGELDLNCFTAGTAEEVGAAYGMALLWLWTVNPKSRSYLPKKGISDFVRSICTSVSDSVSVSTPVERICVENGQVTGVVTGAGENIEADSVICATTASTASRIIPGLPQSVGAVLERVTYGSCCNIALGLDTNILAEGSHAALFPPESSCMITMVTNLKAVTPDAAPRGKTLVHALVIGEHARALFAMGDQEIVDCVLEEMRRFFPHMPEFPLFARVYRWPEALCLSPGGVLKDMHAMRTVLPQSIRGLFLAGDYTRLPSLNGAMKSGIEAAQASMSYVESEQAVT